MKHLVEDWMTKHPLKVDVNEDVDVVADIMHNEAIRHMIVIDQGQLVGVLSEKDLTTVGKIRAKFQGLDCINVKITVGDLMGRNPFTVSGKSTMTEAIRLMNDKGVHSLPVMDDYGRLRGILTSTDIMRYALIASQHIEMDVSYEKLTKGF
jgi:acetoin utilization protein AcuB